MKPEAQRIAIAEALGAKWRNVSCASHASISFDETCPETNWKWSQKDANRMCDDTVPDYPNDLNAMHEAEKVLRKDQHRNYIKELVFLPKAEWTDVYEEVMVVAHATAAQRAEAFLKTIGKWEDKG